MFPIEYPPIQFKYLSEEDLQIMADDWLFTKSLAAEEISKSLDIPGYIEACSQMNLTINDWIGFHGDPFYLMFGLPDLVKEALKKSARELNEAIRKKRSEEINSLKMSAMEPKRVSINESSHLSKIFK